MNRCELRDQTVVHNEPGTKKAQTVKTHERTDTDRHAAGPERTNGLVIRGLWSAADSRALRLACSLMTLTHLSPQCPFSPREKLTDKHTGHTHGHCQPNTFPFDLTLEGTENKKGYIDEADILRNS